MDCMDSPGTNIDSRYDLAFVGIGFSELRCASVILRSLVAPFPAVLVVLHVSVSQPTPNRVKDTHHLPLADTRLIIESLRGDPPEQRWGKLLAGSLASRNEKRTRRSVFIDALAERVGFEPTVRYNRTPDFESGAFDHSATFPRFFTA